MLKKIFPLLVFLIIVSFSQAKITNTSIKLLTEQNYSDIWIGLSTGGYELMSEQGVTYEFRIFIKNGMADKSLNNVALSPENISFLVNSIRPERIDQIKPMEIVIVFVNATIPANAEPGRYPTSFDISSDEFPKGVFKLLTEIRVIRKSRQWVYVAYTVISALIIIAVIYRKYQFSREHGRHHKD